MGILWSLIVGGVAGWLAGQFMKGSGYGFVVNILLGLVGGFVGGWVFGLLGLDATNTIGRIICATAGAVLIIVVARAIRR
ncbi:MAG: GlsB/YeaQ/YmgE family stress response membrane protein [Flavobacteriales bacterium]|nr:GlsB/YeaQ/YmgE family stress response membrane protein [Flavobacteriales bacterium]